MPITHYPWSADIQTQLHAPSSRAPQYYFHALQAALEALQCITPPLCHMPYHPETHYRVWQRLLNLLLLLEKCHLLLIADPKLWLTDIRTKNHRPNHPYFHLPSFLIGHTLALLPLLSWDMVYPETIPVISTITLEPSLLFPHGTEMTLSDQWHTQFISDQEVQFTGFITQGQMAITHYLDHEIHTMTPAEQLRYATVWQDTQLIQKLLTTHTATELHLLQDNSLSKNHPFYLALTHHTVPTIALLRRYIPLNFDPNKCLQLCLDHLLLPELAALLDSALLPLDSFFAHATWHFKGSNGLSCSLSTHFLIALWHLSQHHACFNISTRAFTQIVLKLLLRILLPFQETLFLKLTSLPLWYVVYAKLSAQMLWEFFNTLVERALTDTPTEIPTIHTFVQLAHRIPALPILFAQLTIPQWQALCDTAVTEHQTSLAKFLLHNPVGKSYIERSWRDNIGYVRPYQEWTIGLKNAAKTPLFHVCDASQHRLLQALFLHPTPIAILIPSTNPLFAWPTTTYAALLEMQLPYMYEMLQHLDTVRNFCINNIPDTLDEQTTVCTALYALLLQLERWVIEIERDPDLLLTPQLLQYTLQDLAPHARKCALHYPAIFILQAIHILKRIPLDKLPLDLRNSANTYILPAAIQQQLREESVTHFERVTQHIQSRMHESLKRHEDLLSELQQVRLAAVFALESWLRSFYYINPTLPLLPTPHEWSTFQIMLTCGRGDYWLGAIQLQQQTATIHTQLIPDEMEFLLFSLANHIDFSSILLAFGAGWLSPLLLLQKPPRPCVSILNEVYSQDDIILKILVCHLLDDPLQPYDTDDLLGCVIWACCVTPAQRLLLKTLFKHKDFQAYFETMLADRLIMLCDHLFETIDSSELKPILSLICEYITCAQWKDCLQDMEPSDFVAHLRTQLPSWQAHYPALREALHSQQGASSETSHLVAELIHAETTEAQRTLKKKAKAQAKKQAAAEKRAQQLQAHKQQAALAAQKQLGIKAAQEAACIAQKRQQTRAAYQQQRYNVAIAAAETARAQRIERETFARNALFRSVMAELTQVVNATSSSQRTQPVEMSGHTVTLSLPFRLPPFLQNLKGITPSDWPLLVPGHTISHDKEWHLWLIVPLTYHENLAFLPQQLWHWPIQPYEITTIHIDDAAYPEYRFSCILPSGHTVRLIITQLADPRWEIMRLLQQHMIGLTAIRINIHNGEHYVPNEKAHQDLQHWVIDFLNPDRDLNQYPYSPKAIAYAVKTLLKLSNIPGYQPTPRLMQYLRTILSQPEYQHAVRPYLEQYHMKYSNIWTFYRTIQTGTALPLVENRSAFWQVAPLQRGDRGAGELHAYGT
ncbi:MAG: hypothetical protein A3J38_03300 [Gammaproteobacteria bacterium RIFCSPHIGHO2_12_FULL_45_9]|nr:MAG: hypothetical protein A3J38_03300 [Gammaproteobacteria bacterium RIFCSPHIGHO2_12_FULL_45_9]